MVRSDIQKIRDTFGQHHDLNNIQQVCITTVTENIQKYSQSDIKRADGVRALQKIIGHPTARHLSYLLDHHLIPNSPYTSHDVRRAEQIYGPDLGNLKGKNSGSYHTTMSTHNH